MRIALASSSSPSYSGFVLFSGYRASMDSFVAIGLHHFGNSTSTTMVQAQSCEWVEKNGDRHVGQVTVKDPSHAHPPKHLQSATLTTAAGAAAAAGKLPAAAGEKGAAARAAGGSGSGGSGAGAASGAGAVGSAETVVLVCLLGEEASLRTGGQLRMEVNGEDVLVYEEEGNQGSPSPLLFPPHFAPLFPPLVPPFFPPHFSSCLLLLPLPPQDEETLSYNLMYCSTPIHVAVHAVRFAQWLNFHRTVHHVSHGTVHHVSHGTVHHVSHGTVHHVSHGTVHHVDYFQLYDAGGVEERLLQQLAPAIEARAAAVMDMRAVAGRDGTAHGQARAAAVMDMRTVAGRDGTAHGQVGAWVGGCMGRWVGAWVGGWVHGQVGGCMGRWVGAWAGGWVHGQDGGMGASGLRLPAIEARAAAVMDMRAVAGRDGTAHGQLLAFHDCLYFARTAARWALFLHPDEYLLVQQPPHSIAHVLVLHQHPSPPSSSQPPAQSLPPPPLPLSPPSGAL
ncbi:unnamed protein product [Closterium sp. NIES-65]|nr:unnamed protein product [Closterium sp. NIES-65]